MMVFQKALSRRTFLRGAGATIALPLLDAMIPAMTARAAERAAGVKRLGYVFMPMGCDQSRWFPKPAAESGTAKLEELTPILRPLAKVKDHVSVLANVEVQNAYPGTHSSSNASFMSCARPKHTESSDYFLGTTADQVAAKQLGKETQRPSLEMAMDMQQNVGQCDNGFACVYQNNLSWSSPTTPLPAEAHPRLVFESLFGDGGSPADRQAALKKRASLLDFVKEDLTRLGNTLGPADKTRIAEYLDAVRDVETRIQKAEKGVKDNPLRDLDRPVGVPAAYADHARLMFDLQLLAFQGDVTRVVTFQLARETSNRTYPEIGVPDPHHPLTHHGNDPAKIARMAKVNEFHVSLFAEFVAKMLATKEGDGTLLDRTLLLYGSGMGNPNVHDHVNLPILVAGGAGAKFKGGRYVKFNKPTPLANLHLTLLDKAGVRLDKFADSNGKVDDLFEPLGL